MSYNWKKRVLCIDLKTVVVKEPEKEYQFPNLFTSYGGFDWTELQFYSQLNC